MLYPMSVVLVDMICQVHRFHHCNIIPLSSRLFHLTSSSYADPNIPNREPPVSKYPSPPSSSPSSSSSSKSLPHTFHGIPTPTSPDAPPSSPNQLPISQLYRYTPNTSLPPSLSLSDLTRPGGRQSVSGIIATVFGASGFIGRYTVSSLGSIGSQVIIPYRGDGMNIRHLKMAGDLGQIVPVPYQISDETSIRKSLQRSNVVINLIGSRYQTVNYSLDDVNVKIPFRLASISKQCGVERFIHISCVGADRNSPSEYYRSKWEGEEAVRQVYPDVTIIRPTVVFGAEDRFLNWIATMGERFIALPVVNRGQQLLQPIYVDDVAKAILSAVLYEDSIGKTYEIAGPNIYTYQEIVDMINVAMYGDVRLLQVPEWVARFYGRFWEGINIKPLKSAKYMNDTNSGLMRTLWDIVNVLIGVISRVRAPNIFNRDMIHQQRIDQIPSGRFPGLESLGLSDPTSVISQLNRLMVVHKPEGKGPAQFMDIDRIKREAQPSGV